MVCWYLELGTGYLHVFYSSSCRHWCLVSCCSEIQNSETFWCGLTMPDCPGNWPLNEWNSYQLLMQTLCCNHLHEVALMKFRYDIDARGTSRIVLANQDSLLTYIHWWCQEWCLAPIVFMFQKYHSCSTEMKL